MEERTVVLVNEFLDTRGAAVDDFGGRSGFNPDTEGFYGLGIDLVGLLCVFACVLSTIIHCEGRDSRSVGDVYREAETACFVALQATPMNSLIPQVLASTDPPQEGLVVGIDMLPYSLDVTEQAGVIHWGAVPEGSYRGGW